MTYNFDNMTRLDLIEELKAWENKSAEQIAEATAEKQTELDKYMKFFAEETIDKIKELAEFALKNVGTATYKNMGMFMGVRVPFDVRYHHDKLKEALAEWNKK